MIETFKIRNYKVLREVDFHLRPLTLIVGPNASGKTTILEAIEYLLGAVRNDLPPFDVHDLLSRAARGDFLLECRGRFLGEEASLRWRYSPEEPALETRLGGRPWPMDQKFKETLGATFKASFDLKKLAAPSYPKQTKLVLPPDGDGLSSILSGLHLQYPARFRDLVEQLRQVIPVVRDLRFRRASLDNNSVGDELLFDMTGTESVPARSVSHGTLMTLGVLTVLATPDPPKLLLLDDLESGLHPKALGDLVRQLRKVQEQNPELQIVATSHSPYLLDYLQAEEILLTSLDEEGYAVVRSLTEHPEYERWKDLMAPGEFWSTVGEDWVTKTPPEPEKSRITAG
jgi:predicted ATPase